MLHGARWNHIERDRLANAVHYHMVAIDLEIDAERRCTGVILPLGQSLHRGFALHLVSRGVCCRERKEPLANGRGLGIRFVGKPDDFVLRQRDSRLTECFRLPRRIGNAFLPPDLD